MNIVSDEYDNLKSVVYSDEFAKAWIGFGEPYKKALNLIAKNKEFIASSAKKWGVDPQAIASVIFQEKFMGKWADIKNLVTLPKLIFDESYSFGLSEMQIQTAKRLLKVRGEKGTTRQAIAWLGTEVGAIDLTAQYLKELQEQTGKTDPQQLAQAYNLGADKFNKGYYSNVGRRSKYFQKEIAKALRGEIE